MSRYVSTIFPHVLQFMDETKLIRDCNAIGIATTRGLSCLFSAMINNQLQFLSEGMEARMGSACLAEDTNRRREEAH